MNASLTFIRPRFKSILLLFNIIPDIPRSKRRRKGKQTLFKIFLNEDDGYYYISLPHFRHKPRALHRHLFEQYHKCCLLSWSVIHHKDGNKKNNAIWNLQLTDRWNHMKLHSKSLFNK